MGYNDNRRDSRPQMHRATCSDCGQGCQVPFRPTGSKPVFCSDCFEDQGGGRRDNRRDDRRGGGGRDDRFGGGGRRDNRRDDRRGGGGRDFKQNFSAVCDTCHSHCEVPFKPTSGKPIYCDNCFGNGGSKPAGSKQNFDTERKLKELNKKIDLILKALNIEIPKKKITTIDLPKTKKPEKKAEKKEEIKNEEVETEKVEKKAAAKKTTTKKAAPKKKAAVKKVAKKTTKKAATKKAPAKKKAAAKKK